MEIMALKNTITEIKTNKQQQNTSLDDLKSRSERTENRINEFVKRSIEFTQSEQQRRQIKTKMNRPQDSVV